MSSLSFRSVRLARRTFAALAAMSLAFTVTASVIDYKYVDGRLVGLEYDDGTIVQYSYDNNGNRTATVVIPPVDATPPTVPGNVVATASSPTQIGLNWSASSDAVGVTGYELQRCAGGGCSSFSNIGTATSTSFSDSGLSQNTTYRYRLRAYDAAGNFSNYSAIASATTSAESIPPSVPSGLQATPGSGTLVNLSWGASTDAGGSNLSGYKIERCQGSGCSGFTQIAVTAGTSHPDNTVSSAVTYQYRVRAYDGAGNHSGFSNTAPATTPDTVAPTAPTGLGGTATSSTSVILTWTGSTDNVGVTGYRVYRGGTQIGTTGSTSYTDNGVSGSTSYTYTVTAYDLAGNNSASSNSAPVTTPDTIAPAVPTGLSASAASSTQVNLSWNAVSDTGGSGLAGYRVYRNGVHITNRSVTNYSDTSVTASTAYSYTVAGYDNAGNTSAQSSAANVTTPAPPDTTAPSVPTGVATSVVGDNQVNISWSASTDTGGSGMSGYRIYRGGTQIGTSSTTSFADSGVSPFNSYSYTVASYDVAGNVSGQSSAASAVTSIQITNTSGNVLVGASSLYQVEQACPNQTVCYWFVRKKYGDQAPVVTSMTHNSSPACNGPSGGTPVTGYQRAVCVVRAAPSKYGN
jgi:YD repeat-containing protein